MPNQGSGSPSSRPGGKQATEYLELFVMEDKEKKQYFALFWQQTQRSLCQLLSREKSVNTGRPRPTARPIISLKARMLGEQAKTIMRQGDSAR
jgi:hypothetical protein